ncbi:MAG: SUMF1/EgtB/PvdO family nonheme iron enzyme [Zoogloea sp.]|nr:SUMF1/EgtB/PvdO family nonheme iron enzyme [Zoogloea sp.]
MFSGSGGAIPARAARRRNARFNPILRSPAGFHTRKAGICRWGSLRRSRVVRGGSWINNSDNCRVAYRNRNTPDNRNNNLGFRVCCSPHIDPFPVGAVPPCMAGRRAIDGVCSIAR